MINQINLSSTVRCVLITSGSIGAQLVHSIHDEAKLKAMTVCSQLENLKGHQLWAGKFTKVRKLSDSFDDCVDSALHSLADRNRLLNKNMELTMQNSLLKSIIKSYDSN